MTRFHTHAAIVATGDELAIGQSLNTNSKWLADHLLSLGIETVEHIIVGDDLGRLVGTLRRLCAELPLVIVTGGLGPTLDDVTREALSLAMGDELVTDQASLEALERRFTARGRTMSENQRRQALRPQSAVSLSNDVGTAPGLYGVVGGSGGEETTDVFCVPGPPRELWPMFERDVVPRLRSDPARIVRTRLLHIIGLGEGDAAAKLGALMERSRSPLVGITAAGAVLTVRIRAVGTSTDRAEAEVAATEAEVRALLGSHIFGVEDETLEGTIVSCLRAQRRTLATVESCTAGMLGAMITQVPGASDVLIGGWITYSDEFKSQMVGVPRELLDGHGAVSEPVARAMALGGLERSGATDCVSITGIAGPGGGSDAKPVGTVYVGRAWRMHPAAAVQSEVRRFLISGDREDIRGRSARSALAILYFGLIDPAAAGRAGPPPTAPGPDASPPIPRPPLLWEIPVEVAAGKGR